MRFFALTPAAFLSLAIPGLIPSDRLMAGDVQWAVSGTFSDGGTVSGAFVYDSTLDAMRSWNLSVAGGNTATFAPFTYTPSNSSFSRNGAVLTFEGPPDPEIKPRSNANRLLKLKPLNWPLSNKGGTVPLVTASVQGSTECWSCSPSRSLTGALVGTPVPPSSADLAVSASHMGTFEAGQAGATYKIVVTNVGAGPTTTAVTVVETLPPGVTPVSMSGTGWSCTLSTLTCSRADPLNPGASYPPVTVGVNIAFDVVSSITNTVTVSGGGDSNTGNNVALDPTTVVLSPSLVGLPGTPENPVGGSTTTVNQTTIERVNTATGNTYLTFSDSVAPGPGLRFRFIRSYNSLDSYSGSFGRGWTHSYNILLRLGDPGVVAIKESDGHVNSFQPGSTPGSYVAPPGVFDVLVRTGSSTFTLRRPDHTILAFGPIPSNPALIRLLTITDRNGNAQSLSYDAKGNLILFTDMGGGTFVFRYDAFNHLTSLYDAVLNRTLLYTYDSANISLATYTDAVGARISYSYTANNQLNIATDARSNIAINSAYDAKGRVLSIVRTCGANGPICTTTFQYDDTNHITTIKDPYGRITTHYYDSLLRLIRIVNALGNETIFTYDANNDVTSITNPLGQTTRYTYDAHGNRTSVTDPMAHVTTFVYDANDNLIRQTDANGNSTTYGYDSRGNLLIVTDALGGITRFEYDSRGNRIGFTNANGAITRYAYDLANRLLSVVDPVGNTTSYSYDAGGRLIRETEPAGNGKTLVYDGLGRILSVSYTQGTMASLAGAVAYAYDGNGNRLTMADSTGTTSYSYDPLNRVTSIIFPGGRTVTYGYDCNDNRTSLEHPGQTVTFTYDVINRMASVADGRGVSFYTYDATSQVLGVVYPNGGAVRYAYDAAGRIVQVQNSYFGSEGNPISTFSYLLDRVGNRLQITDGGGKVTALTYDPLYRLRNATVAQKATSYTYDAVGNRLTLTAPATAIDYTYDPADRLTRAGSTRFVYDSNGNQLESGSGSMQVTYAYDSANRLVRASRDQTPVSAYAYDGDGNRVKQEVPAGVYSYLNDVSTSFTTVLQETGPDGTINYLRGRGLIAASGETFTHYYHYDGQSTVAGITDATGHLAQRYVYDVWGVLALDTPGPQVGTLNKFMYAGEARDPETSLMFLRARYYDPVLGRFISKDPIAGFIRTPQTLNRFVYVRNNPATLTDRTGRCSEEDGWSECFPDGSEVAWPDAPWWP